MYDHETESQCFHYAKSINQILSDKKKDLERFYNTIVMLAESIFELQFRNANRKLVEDVTKNP